MHGKTQNYLTVFLLLSVGCSAGSTGLRTSGSETSSEETESSKVADSANRPRDEGVTPEDYTTAAIPNPISGVNLVEVLVSANCVTNAANPCSEVRLSAKVKVNSANPVRFAKDTAGPFGVKSSSWDIPQLANATCLSTGNGYDFNPICSSKDGISSLATSIVNATLILVAIDGTIVKGSAPNTNPDNTGKIHGNFMLLDGIAGLTPTGKTVYGVPFAANGWQPFTEIWLDLVSGLYLTNILYDGSDGAHWDDAIRLCRDNVNSGDGTGDGRWRVPSADDLCGPGYASSQCNGGFFDHGIRDVAFSGGDWNAAIWSSSPVADTPTNAWGVGLIAGGSGDYAKTTASIGFVCIR